jgi:DNA-binding FadR family transcriptional regulator
VVIAPIERASLAEEITGRLRSMILRGELAAGSRLPAERDLAEKFGTNRNTLREALRTLAAQGLVSVRQGAASEVLDFRTSGNLTLLPFYLREVGFVPELLTVVRDLYALRRTFVVGLAEIAAANPDPEARARVEALTRAIILLRGDSSLVAHADLRFYRGIVEATGSLVHVWLFNTIAPLFELIVRHAPEGWEFPADYYEGVAQVAGAIADGLPGEAARALSAHLERTDAVALAFLEAITAQTKETR